MEWHPPSGGDDPARSAPAGKVAENGVGVVAPTRSMVNRTAGSAAADVLLT